MKTHHKGMENAASAASHPTEAETAGLQALDAIARQEEQLDRTYAFLAQATDISLIKDAYQETVAGQIQSLHRASGFFLSASQRTSRMADELAARYGDMKKSLDRRWYLPNPPANGAIDFAEQHQTHFAQGLNHYKLFLILFVGSFAGVVVELLWCLLRHGYLESRSGLVYGPFNLLYGFGAAVLSISLYRFRNRGKWLSFLGGMIVGSAVEYFCSWLQESLFGSVSWDYSSRPFNLNGRICLLYAVFWGVLGVIWIKDIYPRMSRWILHLPNRAGKAAAWCAIIFLLVNSAVSGAAVMRWADRTHGKAADTPLARILDERFPDERMESIYANMVFR